MSLSKQQLIGFGGGGVLAIGVLALGWMFYSAWAESSDAKDQLEGEISDFTRLTKAEIYPCKASIDAVKSNETSLAEWRAATTKLIAKGDKVFAAESPVSFKQRMLGVVRGLASLPGGENGKIAASSFLFGFERYLGDNGVTPNEADVPYLSEQLDTISLVVNMFAKAGVSKVLEVQREDPPATEQAEEEETSAKARRAKAKGGKAAEDAAEECGVTKKTYVFKLVARPSSFVTVLNGLVADSRFMTVRNLEFGQNPDVIAQRLAEASAGKDKEPKTRRSRRSARQAAPAAEPTETPQMPDVFDPEVDAALQISFSLDVTDFGHGKANVAAQAEEKRQDATAPEVKPTAEKPTAEKPVAEKATAKPQATEKPQPTEKKQPSEKKQATEKKEAGK